MLMPLVKSKEAEDFFALPNIRRKLMLGDPDKLDSSVYNVVVAAHNAVGDGIANVSALNNDATRNEVQRHAAAAKFAERAVATLESARKLIAEQGERLKREATDAANSAFAADPNRATIQTEWRDYIRREAKKANGVVKIREAMETVPEVAAVIFHSHPLLLGITERVWGNLRIDAMKTHLPAAYAKLQAGIALADVAAKYPDAIAKVRRTFSHQMIAEQAKTRVEV